MLQCSKVADVVLSKPGAPHLRMNNDHWQVAEIVPAAITCRQGRVASCPMCAAAVELRIQWRLPFRPSADDQLQLPPDEGDEGDEPEAFVAPGGNGGGNNLFPELQVCWTCAPVCNPCWHEVMVLPRALGQRSHDQADMTCFCVR